MCVCVSGKGGVGSVPEEEKSPQACVLPLSTTHTLIFCLVRHCVCTRTHAWGDSPSAGTKGRGALPQGQRARLLCLRDIAQPQYVLRRRMSPPRRGFWCQHNGARGTLNECVYGKGRATQRGREEEEEDGTRAVAWVLVQIQWRTRLICDCVCVKRRNSM